MKDLHDELRQFARNAKTVAGNNAKLEPPPSVLVESAPGRDVERAKRIFRMRAKMDCPDEFVDGLFLPERLSLTWVQGGHLGEANLNYMSKSLIQKVDLSQQDLEFFGTQLSDYRIIDEVHALAGPFFVMYRIVDEAIDPQLFHFDGKECWKMDISYQDYLQAVFSGLAPVFWHGLYIDEPLIKTRAEQLGNALEFLSQKLDGEHLQDMQKRLEARR